jgi:4'-phosphopantetheinyl transferase
MRPLTCLTRFPWPRQSLAEDEVQLWRIDPAQVSADVDVLRPLLGADEWDRANGFHRPEDRLRHLVTRGLLRLLIEAYGVAPAAEIRFAHSAQGKPRLSELHRSDWLHFNLSHTRGLSVMAFARAHPVGVDVERLVELNERDELAASCFSARERAEYRRLPAEDRLRGFFNGWTRKEAFIKATGEGLQRPLDSFSVSLAPGREPRLLEVEGDPQLAAAWVLEDLTEKRSGESFVLALAVRNSRVRVTHRLWESLT